MKVLFLFALGLYAGPNPADAVREFYSSYASIGASGLPDSKQLARVAPRLSEPLAAAMKRASVEQQRCRKAHSDEKPPWVEGNLFVGNAEGYTRIVSVTMKPAPAGRAEAGVEFEYVEGVHTIRWTDHILLVSVKGRWLVDDMRFRGSEVRLRESLLVRACE